MPLLRDRQAAGPHATVPLHWQLGAGSQAHWAVREGDWKLIHRADEPPFLVNLRDDPGEKKNIAAAHADVVKRLTGLHAGHLRASP